MNWDVIGGGARSFIDIFFMCSLPYVVPWLIMWLLRTNESTILLWRRIYLRALEPLHGRFLFIHAQTILRQVKHGRVFLVSCKKWLVQCTLQYNMYTKQVTFSKVPARRAMFTWSPCMVLTMIGQRKRTAAARTARTAVPLGSGEYFESEITLKIKRYTMKKEIDWIYWKQISSSEKG